MPEDVEVETDKLREQVDEAREMERAPRWIRYVALSAAIFAVVAAISALRSGDLINEAMIGQIRASDKWNEYQASRQKEHIYTVAADGLAEQASKNGARLRAYRAEIAKEQSKEGSLSAQAAKLQDESEAQIRRHHFFEYAVALLQVAIALGAVAALTRSKPAWYVSLAAGVVGVALFLRGFAP